MEGGLGRSTFVGSPPSKMGFLGGNGGGGGGGVLGVSFSFAMILCFEYGNKGKQKTNILKQKNIPVDNQLVMKLGVNGYSCLKLIYNTQ